MWRHIAKRPDVAENRVVARHMFGQVPHMTQFLAPIRRFAALCSILLTGLFPLTATADTASETAAFHAALVAAQAQDWPAAATAVKVAGPVATDVIEWQRLRASVGTLSDYEAFLARRPDWPGLPLLKEKGEVAVARSTDPARVIAFFGADLPRTGIGSVALVKALLATGRMADAENEAQRGWAALKFTAEAETEMLALQAEALKPVHEVRLDHILWAGDRVAEANRMLPRVSKDWQALAAARMALRADAGNAVALVEAVPQALADDPGLAFERFLYRMAKDRSADATTLILDRSTSQARLGDPAEWAEKRANLARSLMRAGKSRDAYRVASTHQLSKGTDYSDLEFLSGFIALRKLNDPDSALRHFANLHSSVETPISLARALYWKARALDAKGDAAGAKAAYQAAAKHQTAYYGLLAAEKLGLSLDPNLLADDPPAGDWRKSGFAQSSVLDAAIRLAAAGDGTLSKRFFLHLGESLTDTELEQLSDTAFDIKEPHIAVLIAKASAERGVILPRAYYPIPDFVPDGLAVSRALALSISRRESEFDNKALSKAGASGLMQLMPATAQKVATGLGLPFEASRLVTDPAFNVTLGSAYLRELVDEFGPAITLVASGYNAGPRRPREWIAKFGDPRRADVDVVDWVETIPFTETRAYVMRVTESLVIYRARLKRQSGPVRITAELTGR